MNMKMTQIRKLPTDEISKKLDDAREELMNLRFRQATGELTDTSQLFWTRRTIARLSTVLNERKYMEEEEGEK